MDKEQRSDNSDCGKPSILALGARLAMSHPLASPSGAAAQDHETAGRPADGTRFVLVRTSHPGNVGAAARAMKVMGFSDLVLVAPRFADVLQHEDTVAMASGATDVLAQARIVVDFNGSRAGFGVGPADVSGAPAFVRLDEYDTPAEPDANAVVALLSREYPQDFSNK